MLNTKFGERPHRPVVTPPSCEWIRSILTPSNTWFLGPIHESAPKRHLDRFNRFAQLTRVSKAQTMHATCDMQSNKLHLMHWVQAMQPKNMVDSFTPVEIRYDTVD